jgi:hypothetical protein
LKYQSFNNGKWRFADGPDKVHRAAIAKIKLRTHDTRRSLRAGDAEEMPITCGS